jgi:hypothetical protein
MRQGRGARHSGEAVSHDGCGVQWPARHEIRVDSVLDRLWSEWFEGLRIESEADSTVLSGTLSDQSALHGLLTKLRDLGLSVISVRRLPPEEEGRTAMNRVRIESRRFARAAGALVAKLGVHSGPAVGASRGLVDPPDRLG